MLNLSTNSKPNSMKNILFVLVLILGQILSAQPKFEFYTSYGYFLNTNTNESLNIDGEHYYWYFSWELGKAIYNPNNKEGVTEFQANGFFYRKDFSKDIRTKTEIKRIRFVPNSDTMKAILYPETSSDINYLILIKGKDGKSFYVEMCFKDKKGNSTSCLKSVVHASYPFEDDYYSSRFPSQD